jgi:hypothetical protein
VLIGIAPRIRFGADGRSAVVVSDEDQTANTVFGVSRQIMFSEEDDDPIIERQAEKGLLLTQLLGEDPPENA